jgi:hypothetical protein
MTAPHGARLSALPYLLAAVLHCAIVNGRNAALMQQKAHRLINKHSYHHEQLDRTAQIAFETSVNAFLEQFPNITAPIVKILCLGGGPMIDLIAQDLDQKDASFGKLRDFLKHVLSGDE